MIDTIHFSLPYVRGEEEVLLSSFEYTKTTKKDGIFWYTLTIGNLRVYISISQITVQGSLCKFFLGNNLQSLTYNTIPLAIEKLSDTLHLKMDDAKVTRIDIGANLSMSSPANSYFLILGEYPRFCRLLVSDSSLRYESKHKKQSHSLAFYDKMEEMGKGEGYILRYEDRWMKNLQKQLHYPEITGKSLYDEDFYKNTVFQWKGDYEKISKVGDNRLLSLNGQSFTASKAKDILLCSALSYMPIEERIKIETIIKPHLANGQNWYRFKKSVQSIEAKYSLESTSALEHELNEAITRRVQQEIDTISSQFL